MDAALRAGIAVFDAGEFHAAHDAWEDPWLDLPEGSDDERLLHGLIQFSAAVHHVREENWTGAVGLCESAQEYLDGLPADYRGVNVETVRTYLAALEGNPEAVAADDPPALTHEGDVLNLGALDPLTAIEAALALAEHAGYDGDVFEHAAAYARAELDEGELNEFGALLCDFAAEPEQRGLVAARLEQHVQRRRQREADVAGLFD
jgi:hypothetical protein